MMYFTLALGCLMFVHFGCAILKHEATESDVFLKAALLFKQVFVVLLIRASWNGTEPSWDGSYDDLLFALVANATVNMALSLYIWAHGITFIEMGKHMHKIKASELVASIKKTL